MSERKNPPARPAAQPVGGGPRGPRAMGPRQPIHRESVARLLKYVAPFWPRLILVLCCIIVNAVATASAATFLGRVIDDYITPLLAQAAGGLDPEFQVAFNDIDLCLRLRKNGKLIAFTPFAEFYHCESKSRGADETPEHILRMCPEVGPVPVIAGNKITRQMRDRNDTGIIHRTGRRCVCILL